MSNSDLEVLRKSSESPDQVDNNITNEFKVYRIRWGVMLSVAFLNISNASIWINNFPVASTAANYYGGKTMEEINWFSLIYLIVAIPGCFIGPYCAHRFGLRTVIWLGCSFNCVGAAIRMIATSGLIESKDAQFAVALFGQVFSAIAQNFVLYLHTKVSQTWFPENQRGISTTVLSISDPLGIVLTELTVPFIVTSETDIPLNDKIWFGVAIATVFTTAMFVRRSKPITPPSRSAAEVQRPTYFQQLHIAFTTVPFLLLFLSLGGGVAFTIVIATVTQEIICPLGYSEAFGGFINALMLLCGFIGSAITGTLLDRTKKYTEITMYLFGAAALCGIGLFEFLMLPNRGPGIAIFSALFGLFGVSIFPVGLELAVEATYPVEETMTTAFIFLSGQLQGIAIIAIIPLLAFDKADTSLSVCDLESGDSPKDYTISLMVVMAFLCVLCCTCILLFKTEYKRQKVERAKESSYNINEAICQQ